MDKGKKSKVRSRYTFRIYACSYACSHCGIKHESMYSAAKARWTLIGRLPRLCTPLTVYANTQGMLSYVSCYIPCFRPS